MTRRESDEFNFVGLVRSPVKKTPVSGYYSVAGHHTKTRGDTVSTGTTERMSTGSIHSTSTSSSSSSSRRREVLQPVATNLIESSMASQTPWKSPSSLALLSSSISSKKRLVEAALAARRPAVPVSRTLRLSPADTAGQGPVTSYTSSTRRRKTTQPYHSTDAECSSSPATRGALFSSTDPYDHTPQQRSRSKSYILSTTPSIQPSFSIASDQVISDGFSPDTTRYQPSTPVVPDPFISSPLSGTCGRTYDSDVDDGSAWSDSSFAGAVFSPIPATLAVKDVGVKKLLIGKGGLEEVEEEAPPIQKANSPSVGVSKYAEIGGATPMRARRQTSPCPEGTWMQNINTPAAASVLLRMGGHLAPKSSGRDRPVPRSPASSVAEAPKSSGRDRPVPRSPVSSVAEFVDEVGLSTPAAAATLATMLASGRPESVCRTIGEEENWEEEEEEEDGGLLSQEPLEVSMDVQVHPRSTAPDSSARRLAMGTRRLVMTPKRPSAASALLELSAGTPRRMIRGIIGGVGHPANTRKQQRFVPQVTKVVENIEEETPRRFIIGMAAGNNHQVVGAKTATHDEQNNPAAMIAPCAQSSSTSVAAVAAAAAAAAAAASFTASTAASESAAPDRGETSQSHKENVANSELPQVALNARVHQAPVPAALPSAALSTRDAEEVAHGVSSRETGKTLFNMIVVLNGIALFCAATFGVVVLVCLTFAGPSLEEPIH